MEIRQQFNTKRILSEMIQNLQIMKNYLSEGKNSINLKIKKYVTPISLLPLAAYSYLNKIKIDYSQNDSLICSYLDTLEFPEGITYYSHAGKNYLPITRLPCDIESKLLTQYENTILSKISNARIRTHFTNSLKYLTCELVTNVIEHANIPYYWLLAQYWPSTNICEIAILDTGKGYKASYEGTQHQVESHYKAIHNAIHGVSSKESKERGWGIPSILKIFCNGYDGEVIIMSGDALIYLQQSVIEPYQLPLCWNGAFIGLRFGVRDVNPLLFLNN